jgi:biotin synthase
MPTTTSIRISSLRNQHAPSIGLKGLRRWEAADVASLYQLLLMDLLYRAQQLHHENFDANEVQFLTLLSIKTGDCPEDCRYRPQAASADTGVHATKLMPLTEVMEAAQAAKDQGATRFCMGIAWRSLKERDIDTVTAIVRGVRSLGLETCMTLGMLQPEQAQTLKKAGLDYYNHNSDSSPEFYGTIITTRTYQDRLDTLGNVRHASINFCRGGIVGMGESQLHRAAFIAELANLNPYPEPVPINNFVSVLGTPLADTKPLDSFEFLCTIAVARITMLRTIIRLSAGRDQMDRALQALYFVAGASSICYGDQLLTTSNPRADRDRQLFDLLGMKVHGARPTVQMVPCL